MLMGPFVIIGFGVMGFIAWAIARRDTNDAPARQVFRQSETPIGEPRR